ncbi:hypothetical protein QFW80_03880 [Luteimonas sp. M1R5S18]|uniref:YggT family protein n=1 Tax=Luteimonas rhizosphaericola TaxID=3042024 RepID=A0ABT6JG52_9GAMM|nr:hypothetical protein [Luteimonas rhizosphaericola]MDH5829660.1 hypothetical protein [Luteimonas rhizosphaericola]
MDNLATALFFAGFFVLMASYAIRVWLYIAIRSDRVATPLLSDTFVTTFQDLLWIGLYRRRNQIDPQFKSRIAAYFWLTILTVVLWMAAGLAYWLSA